jgi:membrane protease YdiL (CAAX protease family)
LIINVFLLSQVGACLLPLNRKCAQILKINFQNQFAKVPKHLARYLAPQKAMEENTPTLVPPQSSPRLPQPRARVVLLALAGLFLLCSGVGTLLYQAIAALVGWDAGLSLAADASATERWQVRFQLGLGHFFGFGVAGGLTVWLFYRRLTQAGPDWRDYLGVRQWPSALGVSLAVLLMFVSLPLVAFLLNINQLVPLPGALKLLEEQTADALKSLLQMDNAGELLANLAIIALLPAFGEELVFRGIVQQQLMRRIANPWAALGLSAAIFSFIHLQFEGFLPRLLLGFLLGWLYWRTRNFWVPVAAHFFNNGIQVVGQYLYGKKISTVDLEQDIQVPWAVAAISAFMLWAVMRLVVKTQATESADSEASIHPTN